MAFSEKLAEVIDKFLDNANVGKFVTDVGPGFALSISMLMAIGLAGNISVVPADRTALLARRIYGPAKDGIDTDARLGRDEEYARMPLAIPVDCVPRPALELAPTPVPATTTTASATPIPAPTPSPIQTPAASIAPAPSSIPLHATAEVHREIEALCLVLKDAATKSIGVSDPSSNLTEDAVYRFARRTVADLGARIESFDARRSALQKVIPPTAATHADIEKVGAEKAQLAPSYEQIVAQKESVDEAKERLKTLENELTDARSFSRNIQVFTDNSGTLLVFSIILGVVLSQVSRLVFVNMLYDRFIKTENRTSQTEALKASPAAAEQAEDLVTNYYRYVEGAVNMIAPTALFGLTFCFFVQERFAGHGAVLPWATLFVCIALSVGLGFAGFYTYRDYRKKVTSLVNGEAPQAGEK